MWRDQPLWLQSLVKSSLQYSIEIFFLTISLVSHLLLYHHCWPFRQYKPIDWWFMCPPKYLESHMHLKNVFYLMQYLLLLMLCSYLFLAKISCNNIIFSRVRLAKSNCGISITSSRLTWISSELSFINFFLLRDEVVFLNTSLGDGEGVSPLGLSYTSML